MGLLFLAIEKPILSQNAHPVLAIVTTMRLMISIDAFNNASSDFHNLLGVGDDLGMIERKIEIAPVFEPFCGLSVRSGLGV